MDNKKGDGITKSGSDITKRDSWITKRDWGRMEEYGNNRKMFFSAIPAPLSYIVNYIELGARIWYSKRKNVNKSM